MTRRDSTILQVLRVLSTLLPVGTLVAGFLSRRFIELRARPYVTTEVLASVHDYAEPVGANDLAAVQKLLGDICRYCNPRVPEYLPSETPFPVRVAFRIYVRELHDVLIFSAAFWVAMIVIAGVVAYDIRKVAPASVMQTWFGCLLVCQVAFYFIYWAFPAVFHQAVLQEHCLVWLGAFFGTMLVTIGAISWSLGRKGTQHGADPS